MKKNLNDFKYCIGKIIKEQWTTLRLPKSLGVLKFPLYFFFNFRVSTCAWNVKAEMSIAPILATIKIQMKYKIINLLQPLRMLSLQGNQAA